MTLDPRQVSPLGPTAVAVHDDGHVSGRMVVHVRAANTTPAPALQPQGGSRTLPDMRTKEDIESYLLQAGLPHEEVSEGLWLVGGEDEPQKMVIKLEPPVLVCRVNVMDVPAENREEFYRALLTLNVADMMHGAYGLEDQKVVISDALQLENLDFNEFQATIEDIALAVVSHHPMLSKFREPAAA